MPIPNLRDIFAALLTRAGALLGLPAKPRVAERIARAIVWLDALSRTLAGERLFLPRLSPFAPFPRLPSYPALTAALRAECGMPPIGPGKRDADRLHAIRRAMATEPTGRIAARLARRLGLTPQDAAWPSDLVAITETPAAYAAREKAPMAPLKPAARTPAAHPQTPPTPHTVPHGPPHPAPPTREDVPDG